ncbi:MAG TPA: DUF2627 family protein [Dehalococcoidia bacterium]|jgi:hypothetical protein|nr:DUF2627 family protein [Dehalococcoidia bacterium]
MERHVEGQPGYATSDVDETSGISGWAIGFITFAAVLMMLMGGFHAFTGLVAILDDAFYETPREYFTDFDVSTWGWIHLIGGIIVFAAGIALLGGAVWARIVGIAIALLSALINFAFLPYYPIWSVLMIALSIGVMWALIAHGRDVAVASGE